MVLNSSLSAAHCSSHISQTSETALLALARVWVPCRWSACTFQASASFLVANVNCAFAALVLVVNYPGFVSFAPLSLAYACHYFAPSLDLEHFRQLEPDEIAPNTGHCVPDAVFSRFCVVIHLPHKLSLMLVHPGIALLLHEFGLLDSGWMPDRRIPKSDFRSASKVE